MLSSSEEEEDQDEEELLQKALAEQAQRDVRYSSSSSRSGPPSRKAPVAPPQKAPPPPGDDEESETELLSISSEDDEDRPRKVAAPAARAEADLGIEDFSDEEYEDEPKTWSKVDEEEIARRVRDMRETKSVPAGRFKAASTMARKSTMVRDPHPREDLVDPLGLGTIDVRSLTLISDTSSPRATPARRGSVEAGGAPVIRDQATREKVMYHSEKFDPKFFLAHVHQKTRAADLEDGEAALKADLQNRKQQLKSLVKENFDCFVSCKNTIDDIQSKLKQIEEDREGAGTKQLTTAIQNVNQVAKRAFGPLLERQAQAEKIRSVQGMLQRFRTLFNLPSTIRANISRGEYDMAVREYKKTKSLVLPSHGTILKRVFEEVEKVVQELKHMLSRCMEDPHAEFSQLENAIRLLLELEPDSDPVWQYLNIQERRIRGLLEACVVEHEAQMEALHGRTQQKLLSDARWKQLQSESRRASEVDMFLSTEEDHDTSEASIKESNSDESDALLGRLIRRLTTVLIRFVPDFWKLAISIFKGKFAKISHQGSFKENSQEPSDDDESYPFEEKKDRSLKYTSHTVEEVVAMVQGIVESYDAKVHEAFLPLAETTVMRDYMRAALGEVARGCAALREKDCAPSSAVQAMTSLQMELMHIFIRKYCSLMREKASQLAKEDKWIPIPAVERNGSPFATSSLPLKLSDMLTSSMEHVKEMLDKLKKQSSSPETDFSQMQDSLRTAFFKCFLDVTELLDSRMAAIGTTPDETRSETHDKFAGLQMGLEVVNPHQRLLMMLSNVGYIKNVLLGELVKKHSAVWTHERVKPASNKVPSSASPTQGEVTSALSALEERILNQYNYAKATTLSTVGAAYIDDDCTQWSSAPPVKGVRDAVVELLHPLVAVHAEVFAGARPYVRQVICFLFEGMMAALLEVLSGKTLKHLDMNGYCQLMLELDYIESVLKLYCTSATRSSLSSLCELLLQRVMEGGDLEGAAPEELQSRAQQVKLQYLSSELSRTRINVICFLEGADAIPAPEPGKRMAGSGLMSSSAGVLQVHGNAMQQQQIVGRHRRRSSGSSFSDDLPGGRGLLPPLSPYQAVDSLSSYRRHR